MTSSNEGSILPGRSGVRLSRFAASERGPEPGTSAEPDPEEERIPTWRRLDRAQRLLRGAARTLDSVAAREGWPVPFSPIRFLVLAHLRRATTFGLPPVRLARTLDMKRSSLAHHLDVLEGAGLVDRAPKGVHDRRKVAVRLTERGVYALWRLGTSLRRRESGRRRDRSSGSAPSRRRRGSSGEGPGGRRSGS